MKLILWHVQITYHPSNSHTSEIFTMLLAFSEHCSFLWYPSWEKMFCNIICIVSKLNFLYSKSESRCFLVKICQFKIDYCNKWGINNMTELKLKTLLTKKKDRTSCSCPVNWDDFQPNLAECITKFPINLTIVEQVIEMKCLIRFTTQ